MKQTESHYVQYYNPRIGNSPNIKGCIQTAKEKKQSHNDSPCLMHGKTGSHHQMVDMTLVCLKNELETKNITTRAENMYLSSSVVKQVCELGGDISTFVPAEIREDIIKRIKN